MICTSKSIILKGTPALSSVLTSTFSSPRYTGALYGRIVGLLLVSMFGIQTDLWGAWIDPGLFAAVGAASFFSGVSRLTISLTVIMVCILDIKAKLFCEQPPYHQRG